MTVDDPRDCTYCWSRAEVTTPDAIIRSIACGRGRHRWGRHRNDHVRWTCPPRCGCVRHTARSRSDIRFWLHRRTDTAACWLSNHGHHRLAGWLWRTFRML